MIFTPQPLPTTLTDEDFCTLINDTMVLQKNIVLAANYEKIQPHSTDITWNTMKDSFSHPELATIDMIIIGDWDWHIEFSSMNMNEL